MDKFVAEFGATTAKLSPTGRQCFLARKAELSKLIVQIVAEPDVALETLKLVAKAPPDIGQGEGLGALVSTILGIGAPKLPGGGGKGGGKSSGARAFGTKQGAPDTKAEPGRSAVYRSICIYMT